MLDPRIKYYIIAHNKMFLDEYGFETKEQVDQFKKENKNLKFGEIHTKPILINNE